MPRCLTKSKERGKNAAGIINSEAFEHDTETLWKLPGMIHSWASFIAPFWPSLLLGAIRMFWPMDAGGHRTELGVRAGCKCLHFWFLLTILFLQWTQSEKNVFCENWEELTSCVCKAPMSGTVEKIVHNKITKITFGMTGAHPVANKMHQEVLPLFYVAVFSNQKMLPGFTVHLMLCKADSGPFDCDEGIWIYVLFPCTCTLSPKNNPNRNETLDYGAIWMILFRNSPIGVPLSCAWMQMRTLALCEGQEVNGVLCNRRPLAHFFQSRKTSMEAFFCQYWRNIFWLLQTPSLKLVPLFMDRHQDDMPPELTTFVFLPVVCKLSRGVMSSTKQLTDSKLFVIVREEIMCLFKWKLPCDWSMWEAPRKWNNSGIKRLSLGTLSQAEGDTSYSMQWKQSLRRNLVRLVLHRLTAQIDCGSTLPLLFEKQFPRLTPLKPDKQSHGHEIHKMLWRQCCAAALCWSPIGRWCWEKVASTWMGSIRLVYIKRFMIFCMYGGCRQTIDLKRMDICTKRDAKEKHDNILQDFQRAWQQRDLHQVWRLSRALSGKRIGPKRRRYDAAKTVNPSQQEWMAFLQNEGPAGGCNANEVHWDDIVGNAENHTAVYLDYWTARRRAQQDLLGLRKSAQYASLRKMCPPWGIPTEVWRQLLLPQWKVDSVRCGVGFRASPPSPTLFNRILLHLLTSIRMFNRMPHEWQRSHTTGLDKHNGKEGPAGLRLINNLEVLGKWYCASLWRRGCAHSQRDYASGYIRGKSRIAAMLQQCALQSRLRGHRVSHCLSLLDVSNAFPSPTRASLRMAVSNVARPHDAALLQQRHDQTYMCIPARDADLCVQPGSGALQGDTVACSLFLEVYHPPLDKWLRLNSWLWILFPVVWWTFQSPAMRMTWQGAVFLNPVRSYICTCPIQMKYWTKNYWRLAYNKIQRSRSTLFFLLARVLKVSLLMCTKTGCFQEERALMPNTWVVGDILKVATILKYVLVDGQLKLVSIPWENFGPEILVEQRLSFFLQWCETLLCLGWNAWFLLTLNTDSWMPQFANFLEKFCGEMPVERRSQPQDAISDTDVYKLMRLVPSHLELCIRRLQYWQSVAREPHLHRLVLAAVFGKMVFDTVLADGSLHGQANLWAKQLESDVLQLLTLDSAAERLVGLNGRILLLFSEFRNDLFCIDCGELRSKFFSVCIPPPGFTDECPVGAERDEHDCHEHLLQYSCTCHNEDGTACTATFATYQALAMHIRRTSGGTHGKIHDHVRAAVCNQCPWCRNIFASIRVTQNHISRRLQYGRCGGSGSAFTAKVATPRHLQCPFCDSELNSLDQLYNCIVSHFW